MTDFKTEQTTARGKVIIVARTDRMRRSQGGIIIETDNVYTLMKHNETQDLRTHGVTWLQGVANTFEMISHSLSGHVMSARTSQRKNTAITKLHMTCFRILAMKPGG